MRLTKNEQQKKESINKLEKAAEKFISYNPAKNREIKKRGRKPKNKNGERSI